MAAVRDPNFWKRFSTAVHEDDALKEELAKQPDCKHSYVTTLTLSPSPSSENTHTMPSPVATPDSQSHILDPSFAKTIPKFSQHPQPLGRVALRPMTAEVPKRSTSHLQSDSRSKSRSHVRSYSQPSSRRPLSSSHSSPSSPARSIPPAHTRLQKKPTPKSSRPRALSHPFTRHTNASQMTLGFSGRPQSRFKFWTSVTADPSNRDSWLEGQQRKRRQRTYMCWGFWGVFVCIVAGIVAAVLVLKGKGII